MLFGGYFFLSYTYSCFYELGYRLVAVLELKFESQNLLEVENEEQENFK